MNQNAKGNYTNNYGIGTMRNETRINSFLNIQKVKVHQKYPKIFKLYSIPKDFKTIRIPINPFTTRFIRQFYFPSILPFPQKNNNLSITAVQQAKLEKRNIFLRWIVGARGGDPREFLPRYKHRLNGKGIWREKKWTVVSRSFTANFLSRNFSAKLSAQPEGRKEGSMNLREGAIYDAIRFGRVPTRCREGVGSTGDCQPSLPLPISLN